MVAPTIAFSVEDFDTYTLQSENRDRLLEYIGGEIVEVVSNPYSSKIAARIAGEIYAYLKNNDIGHLTGADGGYRVSGERYIPDVAFIRYTRQPELDYQEGYNPNPPDLAVEVLSPGNDEGDMAIKVANYLAAGTHVWLVKPVEQIVNVLEPGQPARRHGINDVISGGTVLPNFTLPVKDIFPAKATSN